MRFLSSLAVLLMASPSLASYSIEWQHPTPSGQDVAGMYWLSDQHGWICGTLGEAFETTDGGVSWVRKLCEVDAYYGLQDIQFLDALHGWAVGDGHAFATSDGGSTWEDQYTGDVHLRGVYFSDLNNGTAVGEAVRRTADGGANWTTQGTPISGPWFDTYFASPTEGWAAGDNGIIHTETAGAFWSAQVSGSDYSAMSFVDSEEAWACGSDGRLAHTLDGGGNWTVTVLPGDYDLTDIDFLDADEGWVCGRWPQTSGATGVVYHTADGGDSWTPTVFPLDFALEKDFEAVAAAGPGAAFVAGDIGYIFGTDDGGSGWQQLNEILTGRTSKDVMFLNAYDGWALMSNGGFTEILRTYNGGVDWQVISDLPTSLFYCISFAPDGLNGWIGGETGRLYHSSDGGVTWSAQSPGTSGTIRDIAFGSNGFGVAAASASGPNVLMSSNWGSTWEPLGYSGWFYTIEMTSDASGYVGGYGGQVLRFDDAGDSWCQLGNPHPGNIWDFASLSHDTLWAMTQGSVLSTTNAGDLWIRHDLPFGDASGISFSDLQNGKVLVGTRYLLTTSDGGSSWQSEPMGPSLGNVSVFFLDPENAWITTEGSGPGILRFGEAGTGIPGDGPSLQVPGTLLVFPNPSTGIAAISFEALQPCACSVSVFDVSGRLVHSRDLGEAEAGPNQWPVFAGDGAPVPSGVYFCRLTAGGTSQTAEFLVLE